MPRPPEAARVLGPKRWPVYRSDGDRDPMLEIQRRTAITTTHNAISSNCRSPKNKASESCIATSC
jgi:hypothetical protein